MPKWLDRRDEYERLAALTDEPWIKSVLQGHADMAQTMANFWKENR